MNAYLWPDLIIIGGGVSQKADKFLPLLTVETEVVAAQMENEAGIVGAAVAVLYRQPPADDATTKQREQDMAPDMSEDDTSN
jgi:polyphosphate glucokinase